MPRDSRGRYTARRPRLVGAGRRFRIRDADFRRARRSATSPPASPSSWAAGPTSNRGDARPDGRPQGLRPLARGLHRRGALAPVVERPDRDRRARRPATTSPTAGRSSSRGSGGRPAGAGIQGPFGNPIPGATAPWANLAGIPAVARCTSIIVDELAAVPWKVYRGRDAAPTPGLDRRPAGAPPRRPRRRPRRRSRRPPVATSTSGRPG